MFCQRWQRFISQADIRQIEVYGPLGEREDRARADRGGWVSDDIKVLPGEPATLSCPYWGSDGDRTFDILVDDNKPATQTIDGNAPGKLFDVHYKIPEEMSKGKKKATVKFQAQAKGVAGGIFGIAMWKGH